MPTTIKIHSENKFTVNNKTIDKLSDAEKLEVERMIREWNIYFKNYKK